MALKLYGCEEGPTTAEIIARAKAERTAEIVNTLTQWGLECAGGCGDQVNPMTGNRYGEVYFHTATMVFNKFYRS